jgi:hypothetical protein
MRQRGRSIFAAELRTVRLDLDSRNESVACDEQGALL